MCTCRSWAGPSRSFRRRWAATSQTQPSTWHGHACWLHWRKRLRLRCTLSLRLPYGTCPSGAHSSALPHHCSASQQRSSCRQRKKNQGKRQSRFYRVLITATSLTFSAPIHCWSRLATRHCQPSRCFHANMPCRPHLGRPALCPPAGLLRPLQVSEHGQRIHLEPGAARRSGGRGADGVLEGDGGRGRGRAAAAARGWAGQSATANGKHSR